MTVFSYTEILNGEVAVGAPVDTALMTALRDNALSLGEQRDPGIPDDAKNKQLLGSFTAPGTNSVTFSSLDLTGFKRLLFTFTGGFRTSASGSAQIGGITIATPSSGFDLQALAWIELTSGWVNRNATYSAGTSYNTGITNASTAVTIITTAGVFSAGTLSMYGER